MRRSQDGFNLVEVLIAMAITAVVILSVVTLFYMGRQNVYGGKQMTAAVAVATRINEDLTKMSRDSVYASFGLATEALVTSPTVPSTNGQTYANCIVRSTKTDAGDATKDSRGYLTTWRDLMTTGNTQLTGGKVTLLLMPRLTTTAPKDDLSPLPPTSSLLQMRAVIEWDEGLRHRNLIVDAVKTIRH